MRVVLRFAICELWEAKQLAAPEKQPWFGDELLVKGRQWTSPTGTLYPVMLSSIDCKVNAARVNGIDVFIKPYVASRRL